MCSCYQGDPPQLVAGQEQPPLQHTPLSQQLWDPLLGDTGQLCSQAGKAQQTCTERTPLEHALCI